MALIPPNFGSVTVPLGNEAPAGMQLSGKDWSLTLNKGYDFQPDPHHKGSFVVTRKP